jgi:hypothetical protein
VTRNPRPRCATVGVASLSRLVRLPSLPLAAASECDGSANPLCDQRFARTALRASSGRRAGIGGPGRTGRVFMAGSMRPGGPVGSRLVVWRNHNLRTRAAVP